MSQWRSLLLCLLCVLAVACAADDSADDANTLQRGLGPDPESLDPQKARSVQAADVLRDIGEGLAAYSPRGELVPAAAERWQISDDGLSYTFFIRAAARWSNGEPLKAEHFVFGLQRLVDPAVAAFYAQTATDILNASAIISGEARVESLGVEAVDDKTLRITLERPVPYLLSLLTHPSTFPAWSRQSSDAAAVYNGAYILLDWKPGSVLRLRRNEHYWNNISTAIDRVNYHVLVEELAELNRYRAGELHTTSNVPPENFVQMRSEYGNEMRIAPYLGVYYYGFNLTRPPFASNPTLRQALSMAIDREVLVSKITGRGEAPAYSWVPPGVHNYDPPELSYAELTQEQRVAIALGLYQKAGYDADNPAQIELRYNSSDTQERIALAVQSMWREALGVETTLVSEEFQVLLTNVRERELTEVFRGSWIGDYNDAYTFLGLLRGSNSSNMPGYENQRFDELLQNAATQTDQDRRRLYMEEAERVLLADHALIPLYFYVSKHLVSPRVRGWEDNVLDYHYSQHLSLDATQ